MGREPHPVRPSTDPADKVFAAALRLKPRQRAALVDRLVETMPPDPAVEAAWEAEIKRRIDEIESGAVKPIRWSLARRQIFAPRRRKS